MTVSASLLVDAQADVNVADSYGRTPLLLSARMGLTPMAGFLHVSLYHRAQRNPTENQIDTLNGFDLFCCDVAWRFRGMIRPLISKSALLNFSIKVPEAWFRKPTKSESGRVFHSMIRVQDFDARRSPKF